MLSIIAERQARANRRLNLRGKNATLVAIHFKKHKENSRVGEDGVNRRMYAGKREDQVTKRIKKRNAGGKRVDYGANKFEIDSATAGTAENSLENLERQKERTKEIRKRQEVARKLKLHSAFEDADARKADHKKAIFEAGKRFRRLHLGEVVETYRECMESVRDGKAELLLDANGNLTAGIGYEKRIQTPALRFDGNTLGIPDVDEIQLEELPVSRLHPAGISYFFIKKIPHRDFDPTRIHPSFFGSDFEREGSKASIVNLGAARTMMKAMNAEVAIKSKEKEQQNGAVKKRKVNGLNYCLLLMGVIL